MRVPSRTLPSLDLLRGFEAAARHLSFTRAADELFVTQSAVSRQIKALEDRLGVRLFRRFNRALLLTDEGQELQRVVARALADIGAATERLARGTRTRLLTVTASVSFAALWLVPRLPRFRKAHPGIDVRLAASNDLLDLARDGIDVAIRFCEPRAAPEGSVPLTGEEVFPVCGRSLAHDRERPLKRPADLARHVLLHYDDVRGDWPWLSWSQWLDAMGLSGLETAGAVHFSHYDQMIQAAVEGEGVALGRTPLVGRQLEQGTLVAPFKDRIAAGREYFILTTPLSAGRAEVASFTAWLLSEVRSAA